MAEFQEVMKKAGRCCAFYKHNCEACSLTNVCPARFYIDKYIDVGDYTYFEGRVMDWVKEHPAPVYPTWQEYLEQNHIVDVYRKLPSSTTSNSTTYVERVSTMAKFYMPIPDDIAQKLGLQPKEVNNAEHTTH